MPNIFYIIKRIAAMDYKNMLKTVGEIHNTTKKSRVWLFADMVKCGFKFGAGYLDYRIMHFYEMNDKQRSTFNTRGTNKVIVEKMNDLSYAHFFANKTEFNEYFSEYIGRDWLDMHKASLDDFIQFTEKYHTIIIKPDADNSGHGIEKIIIKKDFGIPALYEKLKSNGTGIVEEFIRQHDEMSRIYPLSLNTIRMVTILSEGKSILIKSMLRVGSKGSFVDNLNAGGMTTVVHPDTGIIIKPAYDKHEHTYDYHPDTGIKFEGFQIPFWNECVEMCKKAAEAIPQIGYVGWDIGITQNGPLIIEGNHYPGHDIIQMPCHLEAEKTGILPEFRKYVKGI